MRIINGDCLEVLKTLPDESVDSIVTDPPYELGFMGKKWDNTGIAYNVDLWKECLRVLKPGGHLLAFGGTRTYHRMAVAIEDAGFEVRDMIEWVYGSGFPKSLNIGKVVDKLQGNEREETDYIAPDGKKRWGGNSFSVGKKPDGRGINKITKGNSEWEGWGTALKPAHEPICMARKPLDRWWKIKDDGKKIMGRVMTVAENVLKWGTGGINIDESRVEGEPIQVNVSFKDDNQSDGWGTKKANTEIQNKGRFPANLIHDNSEEVRECFPETSRKVGMAKHGSGSNSIYGEYERTEQLLNNDGIYDSGNASRFFKSIIYQAKASKSERNKGCEGLNNVKFTAGNYSQSPVCKTCDKTLNGTNDHSKCSGEVYYREMESRNTKNNHPTVKPVKLMEYLINMVTPKKGIVLDPFMGSGTTGVASKNLSREFIGIELDLEYYKIAESRINNTKTDEEKMIPMGYENQEFELF